MKKAIVVAASFVLVMAFAAPARADHAWENYHWGRTSNPFTLRVVDSVTGVWDGLLPQVTSDWAQSSVLDLTTESGATDVLARLLCQPVAGKIRACSANYGPNFWFGLATIWLSGGHITQATTQVNDFYFTGTYGNDVARRHVLCQEIGHDFGLDHHQQASCMDDTNNTLNLTSYQSPNQHDLEQLAAIYAHTDSTNTNARAGSTKTILQDGDLTVVRIIHWV